MKVESVSFAIKDHKILHDVNLSLPKGQVIALIGPNGAGKSTLFGLMARQNPLQSGCISIGGYDIGKTDPKALAHVVAMLAQDNRVEGNLTVEELLMFGRYPHHKGRPTDQDRQCVDAHLEAFELNTLRNRYLARLSGGQRQRALIAMVLCQDTPYILLDEPLNNLDMYHAGRLMRYLRALKSQGKTTMVVLHDINQAGQFADYVVMFCKGQPYAQGRPQEIITQKSISELFGVNATVILHKGRPVVIDCPD